MQVVDIGCGLWGWTDVWIEEGHEVIGIDINEHRKREEPNVRFIQCDIRDFDSWELSPDVVTCSMPCTEFSIAKFIGYGTQKEMEGLDLVQAALYVIQRLKPKFWIMENVKHLEDFIGPPNQIVKYSHHPFGKAAYLWGSFPRFWIDMRDHGSPAQIGRVGDPRRSRIPRPLAKAFMDAVKEKLQTESTLSNTHD